MRFISVISKPAGPSSVMNSKGGSGSAAPTRKTGAVVAARGSRRPVANGGNVVMTPFARRVQETAEPDIIAHQVCTSGARGASGYALSSPSHAKKWRALTCPALSRSGAPARMKLITTFPLERYDILALRLRMPPRAFGTRQSYYD